MATWENQGDAWGVGIGWFTDLAHAFGEADLTEGFVELVVEGAGGGFREAFGFNSKLRLGFYGGVAGMEHVLVGDKQDPCGFPTICEGSLC
jgi:hypothetical protein